MIKKGEIYRGTIEDLHYEGYGVTHYDGLAIFIEEAVTGDDVSYEIIKINSSYAKAKIIEIHNFSKLRSKPLCPSFGICGGCTWQHINYEEQKNIKTKQLKYLFQSQQIDISSIDIEEAFLQPYHYRRRARFSVKYDKKKDKVLVGFKEKNPRMIAKISICPILKNEKWPEIWQNIVYELSIKENIPQIEYLSADDIEGFTIRCLANPNLDDLKILQKYKNQYGIRIFIQNSKKLAVTEITDNYLEDLNNITNEKYQEITQPYTTDDITINAGPFDFVQINQKVASWMLKTAKSWLNPQKNQKLLDLFCGLGPFCLYFADDVAQAHGIELDEKMVKKAQNHIIEHNKKNITIAKDDLFEEKASTEGLYDIMIVDPPRSGMPLISKWAEKTQAKKILYVSCHMASMVRDIKPLLEKYEIKKIAIMDMFTQTKHAESMVLLEIKNLF